MLAANLPGVASAPDSLPSPVALHFAAGWPHPGPGRCHEWPGW